jgi:hypothetical protein
MAQDQSGLGAPRRPYLQQVCYRRAVEVKQCVQDGGRGEGRVDAGGRE